MVGGAHLPRMDIEIHNPGDASDWKSKIRDELAGYIAEAGLDKDLVFSGLKTQFDEILLHGRYACEHDQVEKSLRSFRECARLQPGAFLPQLALGRIYMGQGLYQAAEKHIRRAAEIHPNHFNTLVTWLFLLNKTKQDQPLFERLQQHLNNGCMYVAQQLGFEGALPTEILRMDQPERFCEKAQRWSAREEYSHNKYTILHDVLPPVFLELILLQQQMALNNGQMNHQPERGRYFAFDQPLSVMANYQLTSLMAEIVGEDVIPTYTFAIHYIPFGKMEPHTDRPQNELSMSLNLAVTPPADFPALRAGVDKDRLTEIWLKPNSGLFYRGPEVTHARCEVPAGHHVDQLVLGFRTVSMDHCSCYT